MQVFEDLDFTLMEMNPFTLDADGAPFPLDMRGELDDTAAFKSGKKWGPVLEFPLPFGRSMTSAEEYIHSLDGKTGASLKLSILNAKVCLGHSHRHWQTCRSARPAVKLSTLRPLPEGSTEALANVSPVA